jgi:MFS family permease
VSSVQSAIALEALVSAQFILISSKLGDLFGRRRAYVLGLLAYATGALAMTLAHSLTAIICARPLAPLPGDGSGITRAREVLTGVGQRLA